jgi:excisionase family DNA binding protein
VFGRTVLTPQEVARDLRVSLKTVYRWIYDGRLPASHLGEKTYRVLEKDLVKFMSKTKVRAKKRR